MKRTIQGLLLAGSLVLGGSALAQSNMGSTQRGTGSAAGDTSAQAGKSMAKGGMVEHMGFKVPADERAFLERLHHINQHEISAGTLAKQNSDNQDVKSYGDMLVKDHTSADQQVMAYAQKKGFKLAEPKPMDDVERRAMTAEKAETEKLQALKGVPFDSCFLTAMVGGHDDALGKLMAGQQGINDTGLTPLLQQISQSVSQHRQQAYSLLGRVGPGASAGVGGSGDMKDMNHDMGSSGDTNKGTMGTGDKNTMDPGNPKKF
jgi:putative membrane protein